MKAYPILLPALMILTGCGSIRPAVVLHPIEQTDIIRVKTGENLLAPKDGYFLSDLYMEKVAQARTKN